MSSAPTTYLFVTETFLATILKSLPTQYLAYFPAAVFLGKIEGPALARGLLGGIGWAIGLMVISRLLYRVGLRRYSAFGG